MKRRRGRRRKSRIENEDLETATKSLSGLKRHLAGDDECVGDVDALI